MRLALTRMIFAGSLLVPCCALANVTLPRLFGDHMVLQREMNVPVWGKADPGEQVTVSLAGQEKSATADQNGAWRVVFDPISASSPIEMSVKGKNEIKLKDVLVGEVWVCSGQSNMEWPMTRSANPETEIPAASYPEIRFFNVSPKKRPSRQPMTDVEADWAACTPESAANFSAVGYYFGRHLHKELGVPVGLINVSWGGMPAEAFTDIPVLKSDPELASILTAWDERMAKYPEAKAEYEKRLADWEVASKEAAAKGQKPATKPSQPVGPDNPSGPGNLWNGMIHPIRPVAMRGVIWYQGETNAPRARQYRTLLPAMINSWRKEWGSDFTFLVVQLANYKPAVEEPVQESDWPMLREAQAMTVEKVAKTGLAVTIDIGDGKDIHPKNKMDVGRRLALAAEKIAYGREVVYSGPVFKSMSVEGNKAVLTFDHAGGGLEARGGTLQGFAIRGEGGAWRRGDAAIEGDKIFVTAAGVDKPAAVRYGWADNPTVTLFNREGLPVVPFRTDRD